MPHPSGGSLDQFWVIFGFPCTGSFAQHFALAAEFNLALRQLGYKRTPAPLADEFVDVGNQFDRKDDVCPSVNILLHTHSVT
jgi:hypothetical protein